MSFEDDNKPGRGAYTPPTDDDLPFRRNSYDPRSGRAIGSGSGGSGGGKAPPVTLIVSAVVLLLLIVAVIFFYRSGMRASTDAPPAVGQPVGEMKTPAPIDAQPIDPAAGVRVYRDETETTDAPVTFTPHARTVEEDHRHDQQQQDHRADDQRHRRRLAPARADIAAAARIITVAAERQVVVGGGRIGAPARLVVVFE